MQRLIVFDATRKPSLLEEGWTIGTVSMWMRERVDGMLGALSWREAFDWIRSRRRDQGLIQEVQFWGHGASGDAYINGQSLAHHIGMNTQGLMNPEGLFWLRTCGSFHGRRGKLFAEKLSENLDCRVAGHTFKIGLLHSGLHLLAQGERAYWPEQEGEGKKEGTTAGSGLFKPNTIPFFVSTIPKNPKYYSTEMVGM